MDKDKKTVVENTGEQTESKERQSGYIIWKETKKTRPETAQTGVPDPAKRVRYSYLSDNYRSGIETIVEKIKELFPSTDDVETEEDTEESEQKPEVISDTSDDSGIGTDDADDDKEEIRRDLIDALTLSFEIDKKIAECDRKLAEAQRMLDEIESGNSADTGDESGDEE